MSNFKFKEPPKSLDLEAAKELLSLIMDITQTDPNTYKFITNFKAITENVFVGKTEMSGLAGSNQHFLEETSCSFSIVKINKGTTKGVIDNKPVNFGKGDTYIINNSWQFNLEYDNVAHDVILLNHDHHNWGEFEDAQKKLEKFIGTLGFRNLIDYLTSEVISPASIINSLDGKKSTALKGCITAALMKTKLQDKTSLKQSLAHVQCSISAVSKFEVNGLRGKQYLKKGRHQ